MHDTLESRYESFLRAATQHVAPGGMFTPEEIATRAAEEDSCVIHAGHGLWRDAIDSGRIATDRCTICGGRNRAGQGDHNLCTARKARGVAITVLDWADYPCSCYCCQQSS